ncbi:hypothetical protein ABT339_28135, partial [Micromonospora sp. NPDC000119]
DETAKPQPPAYGQGGGASDSAGDEGKNDWKGYEHGQDAEGDRGHEDRKDHDAYGSDSRGDNGHEDRKDHDAYGSDSRGDNGHEDRKDHDAHGSDKGDWKKDHENGKDKDRWEHKRDFVYYGEAEVSEDAKPGRYKLKGSCGEGELVVLPRGGVDGGDGGAGAGTDRGLAAGGASLLGAAALGGLVLMRRRRTDESLV